MHNSQQILTLLSRKIVYKRSDTLINHFKTFFQFNRIDYSGYYNGNEFSIWRFSWLGIFYIVIDGEIINENDKSKVFLFTKMNKAGLLVSILIFLGFFFGVYDLSYEYFTPGFIIYRLFFACLPIIAIVALYYFERKKCVTEIEEMLIDYM